MKTYLDKNWFILQDVHDAGEKLGLYEKEDFLTLQGPQMSEWEELPELKQLQLLFSEKPYWGRELRYFNDAPWWYKNEFQVTEKADRYMLRFTNVDYYCRVWLNGVFLGEHEGYSSPFSFDVTDAVKPDAVNRLTVKVWSPWDTQVDHDNQMRRTFDVYRNMVKGTYEHSDTFVQRDVNPVGIYGSVILEGCSGAWFAKKTEFSYVLSDDLAAARITFRAKVSTGGKTGFVLRGECIDNFTREICYRGSCRVDGPGEYELAGEIKEVSLWSTWDQGTPCTYQVRLWLEAADGTVTDCSSEITGFRKIEMIRNAKQTMFVLNHNRFYVRGTAYFPDNYVSAMSRERYKRDLLAMKECGFNMIRVHVHVDQPAFYELCTEIGLGIMHDSEYNWAHPLTDEFAQRFIRIYLETVDMLKEYPALLCWICMNEPGLLDTEEGAGRSHSRSMDVNPGPALYDAVCRHDPTRPVIKGSFCEDDPCSGDSHNYMGSLYGEEGHYSDIYGTTEKLNTEYGIDALPCLASLKRAPEVYRRLQRIGADVKAIGDYQYALLKYYTEHYRMQKYDPNAGYVQFLFSDIGPASYYGLFDWWGIPKKGLDAMLESNMPVGIFLKYKETLDAVYAVNDFRQELGNCTALWHIVDGDGNTLEKGEREIYIGQDERVLVKELNGRPAEKVSVYLVLKRGERLLARNHYEDVFHMPRHPQGHPTRMSHEFGVRLYHA